MNNQTAIREQPERVEVRVVGVGDLENGHGFFLVPSESDPTRYYAVEQWPTHLECQCKDAFYRRRQCKHIRAVTEHKQRQQLAIAEAKVCEVKRDLEAVNIAHASRDTADTAGERWGCRSQRAFSLLA